MENYNVISKTNYFRVTDEARYQDLISCLYTDSGDKIDHAAYTGEDGVTRYMFGAYGVISYAETEEEREDNSITGFIEHLQEILPDNEAFVLLEIGNEKLRDVATTAIVCTRDKDQIIDFADHLSNAVGTMLGSDYLLDF